MKMTKFNTTRERVSVALSEMLLNGFCQRPDILVDIVRKGIDEFVRIGKQSDRQGLTSDDYRKIFRKLERAHAALGLPRLPRIQ